MLARRLPGLPPPLEQTEALEVTQVFSAAGLLGPDAGLMRVRPFRSPHHAISVAGLVGGGQVPRPARSPWPMAGSTVTSGSTMPAAVYVRISSDPSGLRAGVDRQERDCRELAERRGWTVAQFYCDNDVSADSGRPRPAYQQLLADIEAGLVDAVIVWALDGCTAAPLSWNASSRSATGPA